MTLLSTFAYAASIERDLPSSASAGEQVTITLKAVATTGDYFAIVRENIPTGWTYVSGGGLDGNQVKLFVTSLTGDIASYKLKADGGTATFSGTYQFTTDTSPKTITGDTILEVSGEVVGDEGIGLTTILLIAGGALALYFIFKK